ncbi:MAG: hypothetical protein ACR2L2_13400 [Acidobacteriota bacterium]
MKAITLRDIPEHLAALIRRRAKQQAISLNKAVASLLEDRAGAGTGNAKTLPRRHHDLDQLAGSWSKQEAAAFERSLAAQRVVDEEMWR